MTAFLLSALAMASLVQSSPAMPRETVIHHASNGGIRNFQAGPPRSNLVYLQDRRLRWYRVTLSGPCLPDRSLQAVTFRIDPDGIFDRFSQIASRRYPGRTCGVKSIVASLPPAGQPRRG